MQSRTFNHSASAATFARGPRQPIIALGDQTQRGICWHRALISVLMAYQTLAAAQLVVTAPAAELVDDDTPFPFAGPSAYGRRVSTGRGYVRADRIGA